MPRSSLSGLSEDFCPLLQISCSLRMYQSLQAVLSPLSLTLLSLHQQKLLRPSQHPFWITPPSTYDRTLIIFYSAYCTSCAASCRAAGRLSIKLYRFSPYLSRENPRKTRYFQGFWAFYRENENNCSRNRLFSSVCMTTVFSFSTFLAGIHALLEQ